MNPTVTFNYTELSLNNALHDEQVVAHWTRTTLFPEPRIYDLRVRQQGTSPVTGKADWYELSVVEQVNRLLDLGLLQYSPEAHFLEPTPTAYAALADARYHAAEEAAAQLSGTLDRERPTTNKEVL